GLFEGFEDAEAIGLLLRTEGKGGRGELGAADRAFPELDGQVEQADRIAVNRNEGVFEGIPQLPDVAGPGVIQHPLQGVSGDPPDGPVILSGELVDEVPDEQREVFSALPERGEPD